MPTGTRSRARPSSSASNPPGGPQITQPTGVTNSSGQATATITSSTTAGTYAITASDGTVTSPPVTLTQTAGPVANVTVSLASNSLLADGTSTTTATATVTDAYGNPISGETVIFASNPPGGPQITQPTGGTNSSGQATATITSSTTAGTYAITASDGTVTSPPVTLTQRAGPAVANVTVSLASNSLLADGTSTTTATATVTDAYGNPISGETVIFASNPPGGPQITQPTGGTNSSGQATATITSSTTAGTYAITASDGTVTSPPVTLTQTAGPAAAIAIQLSSDTLTADGLSHTTATMTVTDAHRNPVSGDTLHVSTPHWPHVKIGAVTYLGGGLYRTVLRSSNMPGTVPVVVSDGRVSGQTTLTQTLAPSEGTAYIQWRWYFHPHYTSLLSLVIAGAAVGSRVVEICHGAGCPFARHVVAAKIERCRRTHRHSCGTSALDLAAAFHGRRLAAGDRLIIEILRTGWVGKYYAFQIRPARKPATRITCLAPGGSHPGVGCQ